MFSYSDLKVADFFIKLFLYKRIRLTLTKKAIMMFWKLVSRVILKGKVPVLITLLVITVLLAMQMKHMKFSHTEASLLPEDHPINLKYNQFLNIFGEEGNLVILGVQDPSLFTPQKLNQWHQLSEKIENASAVDFTLSTANLQKLEKNKTEEKFEFKPLITNIFESKKDVQKFKETLFDKLPIYEGILFNKSSETLCMLVYLDKKKVNTNARRDFVLNQLLPLVNTFENENDLDIHISGMPYIRTMNTENIVSEMKLFVVLATLVTAVIFFLFFGSLRATFISLLVVCIGVVWAFGFIGLFRYEISVLMALIPPLIVVIGVPNAIFLINKYHQEVKKHHNKVKSLQRVISKIGNATLMTNATTACGFATFIFTNSGILQEFGVIASVSIMGVFILALFIIPIAYSFLPMPKERHLRHLDRQWMHSVVNMMEYLVKNKKPAVYMVSLALIFIGFFGMSKMEISGNMLDDMPKGKEFYSDILFFEKELGGIMPLEVLIDTKAEKGVMKFSSLKKIEEVAEVMNNTQGLSKPTAITNFVKYAKQVFYNGNPEYYQMPNNQDKNWIFSHLKNSGENLDLLRNYADSTGRYARITSYMQGSDSKKMEELQLALQQKIEKVIPNNKFEFFITGKSLAFLEGTYFLVNNLLLSLSIAALLIALFIGWMFKSFKMVLVSVIPNLFPLILTAGIMGYFGIPLKPSTILVFSIAFGISVDDTIHFLAKYRQELTVNNGLIIEAVYKALRETGVSMFYTSIVLFFGFMVFTTSNFGGTIALGGLVAVTLLFAMLSNLILLPCMLLSFRNVSFTRKV
jgi:predicted RND superfamily exporter protein